MLSSPIIYGRGGVPPTPPSPYKTMTAIIDLDNPDPATCVSYADDAVGMTAGSTEWDKFFGHYPCLFKDGQEVGRLNPNNFAEFEDGSPADITSGSAGDVMIQFPRRGVKMYRRGGLITTSMTDDPNNSDYTYYAHTFGDSLRNFFYYGAYAGSLIDGKLRSLSGKRPETYITIANARNMARLNGYGYALIGFYQLVFIQCAYLLKYKSLNSQAALGNGIISAYKTDTGGTSAYGMDYGDTVSNSQHVKLFGIEDMWGNVWQLIDGIYKNSSGIIYTSTDGDNYCGQGRANNFNGSIVSAFSTSEEGFIGTAVGGTADTYFCDSGIVTNNEAISAFGGAYNRGAACGIFCQNLADPYNIQSDTVGARLMYL